MSIGRVFVGFFMIPLLVLASTTSLEAQGAATDGMMPSANVAPPLDWYTFAQQSSSKGAQSVTPLPLRFGVYPGGGTGETPNVPTPSPTAVIGRLAELAGDQPLNIHLFTAWSWYNPGQLDDQIQRFGAAGFHIILTVKYSPPPGHDGDIPGYETFVRSVVARYGALPGMDSFVIGNEANAYGNPEASDGPFIQSHAAVARGVVAAAQELAQHGSSARVGMNFGLTSAKADAGFLRELSQIGGTEFTRSVQFIGINLYPGLWPQGTGRPYWDMVRGLESARASVDSVAGLRGRSIDVLEIGAPSLNEVEQASWLSQFAQATVDNSTRLHVTSLNWFDLWDADSASANKVNHYGLLHSDLSYKPAFSAMKNAILSNR